MLVHVLAKTCGLAERGWKTYVIECKCSSITVGASVEIRRLRNLCLTRLRRKLNCIFREIEREKVRETQNAVGVALLKRRSASFAFAVSF